MVGIMSVGDVEEAGGRLGEVRVTGGLGLTGNFDVVVVELELDDDDEELDLESEFVVVVVDVDVSDVDVLTEVVSVTVGVAWLTEAVPSGPTPI